MLGGITRFKSAIDDLRSKEQNVLLLHAGDAVQGTLYFTQYQGVADYDFLNLLRVDALTLGNHEFDKGSQLAASLVKQANFPVISANLDVSGDTNLKGLISPYTIKSFGTERVGIIGLSLQSTPDISSPGPNVKFNDPTTSVVATVAQLKAQGINKIIVLSHMGYDDDVKLAKAVNGIGVIIGGHSHTMQGGADFKGTGLSYIPAGGPYPTEVTNPSGKKVLVAHAWEWFKILGALKVTFDADGTVQSFENKEKIIVSDVIGQKSASTDSTYATLQPGSDAYKAVVASLPSAAQVYVENSTASTMLSAFRSPIQTLMTTKIATAANDIKRGDNVGPGPIFADSMLWKLQNMNPKPTIAFQNAGGVRADILAGDITVGTVYTVFPFGNTLTVIDLKGSDVINSIEDGVSFQLDSYTPPRTPPYMYVSGVKFTVTRANAKGSRISNVVVKDSSGAYLAIDPTKIYRVVTNNFMAGGGDGYTTFKNTTGYKYDTGINDAESFLDYLKQVPDGTVSNPVATLITVASAKVIEMKRFIARRTNEIERFIADTFRKAA
jgi:5'-nucleotidase